MVSIRGAIESLYSDTCDIYTTENYIKPNGSNGQRFKPIKEGVPCRISYGSSPANKLTETVAFGQQGIKLFLAPEISVPTGSRIRVYGRNRVTEYNATGLASLYPTHQEIELEFVEVVTTEDI